MVIFSERQVPKNKPLPLPPHSKPVETRRFPKPNTSSKPQLPDPNKPSPVPRTYNTSNDHGGNNSYNGPEKLAGVISSTASPFSQPSNPKPPPPPKPRLPHVPSSRPSSQDSDCSNVSSSSGETTVLRPPTGTSLNTFMGELAKNNEMICFMLKTML